MTAASKKAIYIVLVRSSTMLSNLIHLVMGDEYTHAALALDRDLEYMFSFGRRHTRNPFLAGFRREHLDEGLYAQQETLPGVILELEVTPDQYEQVIEVLEEFLLNSYRYGYNYLGLVSSLLHTCTGSENRFVCSEFVYQVLYSNEICDLQIPPGLVRPQDLLGLNANVIYRGDLKQYNRSGQKEPRPIHILRGAKAPLREDRIAI